MKVTFLHYNNTLWIIFALLHVCAEAKVIKCIYKSFNLKPMRIKYYSAEFRSCIVLFLKTFNLLMPSVCVFVCTHLCFALKNMESSLEASRRASATCRTDRHLMLPKVLSSTLNLTLFSFSKTKPSVGVKGNSDRVPCGWFLGVICGGPAVEKEGFLLETNWNNLVHWTWRSLKFFFFFRCLLTCSCAMLCPLQFLLTLTFVAAVPCLRDPWDPPFFYLKTHWRHL